MRRLLPALAALLLLTAPEAEGRSPIFMTTGTHPVGSATPRSSTLSGTAIRSATSSAWLLYPGACADRSNGTWAPRTSPVADSLNTYPPYSAGSYEPQDHTAEDRLWNVVSDATPSAQRPPILAGSRSLWCGRFDSRWTGVGYRNLTFQILYVDTGAHAAGYSLSFLLNASVEKGYDFLYLVGGGGSARDPIGNDRLLLENVIGSGSSGSSELLVTWTGSVEQGGIVDGSGLGSGSFVEGSGDRPPLTVSVVVSGIAADHRALYFILESDDLFSSEDGLWPFGWGVVLDELATSNGGVLYADQPAAGGVDAFQGGVILGTPSAPVISSRVQQGRGALWRLDPGSDLPTADACSPRKQLASDLIFMGADPVTHQTTPGTFSSIASCTLPVPAGTTALSAFWDVYRDLPLGTGYVHYADYREFKNGAWSAWEGIFGATAFGVAERAWIAGVGGSLVNAVGADSVQVRFTLRCIPFLAADHINCQPVTYGVLVDNFRLSGTIGTTVPEIALSEGHLPQSTFVDGTMTGLNCTAAPCWPGIRGSDRPGGEGIRDNVNAASGDSCLVILKSSLRKDGMGINWRLGYGAFGGGPPAFVRDGVGDGFRPAYDVPRWIYRLYDPATCAWSPFDSSEADANLVTLAGADTVVFSDAFRFDWPPRDKLDADATLPGGFTVAGKSRYAELAFLPRGTRLQYYVKAVDVAGGFSYQFSTTSPPREKEDLPLLPGSSIRAPDIMEFAVLPGVYPPGSAGSLLQGRTRTPVLVVDDTYTRWASGDDVMSEALRGLGVRFDRYRTVDGRLRAGTIGGRELPGQRRAFPTDYLPNMTEYGIKDSLAQWYRIVLTSGSDLMDLAREQDARLLSEWWSASTGTDGGDRCLFASGDHYLYSLSHPPAGETGADRIHLARDVFGVAGAGSQWSGSVTNPYPTIDDRFAGGGPGLASPGTMTYPIDGGCPEPNRFDGLTKTGGALNAAIYPAGVSEVAGVANVVELDNAADRDRGKALGYAYSIEFMRKAGIAIGASNYARSGIENRMRVLYKFLTGCRGERTGAGTATCWPCPAPATMNGDWNGMLSLFQTATYGSLYPIQDPARITAAGEEAWNAAPPAANRLDQNRPNPFNPFTVIPYEVATRGHVSIRIFDVGGRRIRTLVDGNREAGKQSVAWDGRLESGASAPSGIYFYRIEFPDGTRVSKKMAILR